MAKKSIAVLYTYFETGDKPSQGQFQDLIDSFWHKDSDISIDNISGLQDALDARASQAAFEAHINDDVAHVTQAEKNIWNASVSADNFNNHANDDVIHVTQDDRDSWDSKADGDHTHQDYENSIQELNDNKADNQHNHIAYILCSPTGANGEANSFRFRQDGADTLLESTTNGVDWVVLQIWTNE